ncbi:hypothetical protein DFA_08928 [Cavenderia fasciculata]|uniref:UbiA prenyltransferase family protein n=1 Tax=Cavenderia fasciculata TaxID=261658 RepID=F4Q534_CACFS|nr:uncharacterized protein DFA_08928 [Cavenderia fasciculata]EGG17927.1 hypothetical protein DFA_08928 [Cavenderia fasciculata]|eukprot:XP_004356411.1 hypothetical protein DFA_08928 [Cavenderia fasciculata]
MTIFKSSFNFVLFILYSNHHKFNYLAIHTMSTITKLRSASTTKIHNLLGEQQENASVNKILETQKPSIIQPNLKSYLKAFRPWSLKAATSSAILGAAIAYHHSGKFNLTSLVFTTLLSVSLQILCNLFNSYNDFVNEVDKDEHSHDRTMFDYGLTVQHIVGLNGISIVVSMLSLIVIMFSVGDPILIKELIIPYSIVAFLLATYYTSNPLKLKYSALGDATIFVSYGPVLCVLSFIIQARYFDWDAIYYSLPSTLVFTAVVHINNSRDSITDAQAGVRTIANFIGPQNSFYLLLIYYSVACLVLSLIAIEKNSLMMILPLITLPKAYDICKKLFDKRWKSLDSEGASFGFMFALVQSFVFFLNQ